MEIKPEFQKMIDEFDAGCYYYVSPDEKVVLEVNNTSDIDYLRFEVSIDGQMCYFIPNNKDVMDIFYSDGKHKFEGCSTCATDELIEKVQDCIIDAKNYIEKNGFKEDCFFKKLNREIEFMEYRIETHSSNMEEKLFMLHKLKNEREVIFWC